MDELDRDVPNIILAIKDVVAVVDNRPKIVEDNNTKVYLSMEVEFQLQPFVPRFLYIQES